MPRFDGRFFPSSTVTDWAAGKFGTPGWYADKPTVATPVEGDQQVALEWTAGDTNGLDITGYKIEQHDGSSWSTITTTGVVGSYTSTGLTNGTVYKYRISAVTDLGIDPGGASVSADTVTKTPRGVPAAPGTLSLSAGSPAATVISLSWSAGGANGSVITGYIIQKSVDSGSSWSTVTADTGNTNTTYSATGLAGNTAHQFRVAAINVAGTGSYGNTPSLTTADPNPTVTSTGSPTQTDYSIGGTNYRSLRWTGSGSVNVTANPLSTTFDILVVSGGGGGGGYNAGGGGAGGFKEFTGATVSNLNTSVSVTVGGGGAGVRWYNGSNGSNSSVGSGLFNIAPSTTGGGGGGGGNPRQNGSNGGSGGGGGNPSAWGQQSGGTGVSGEGNEGGRPVGNGGYHYSGGGGGGAGSMGQSHGGVESQYMSGTYTYIRVGSYGGKGKGSNFADGVTGDFDDTHSGTVFGTNSFAGGGAGSGFHYIYSHGGQFGGMVLAHGGNYTTTIPTQASHYLNDGVDQLLRNDGGWGSGNSSAPPTGQGRGTYDGVAALANTGSGGGAGGDNNWGKAGGSGCVVIRWVRV